MMRAPNQYRVRQGLLASTDAQGNNGAFQIPCTADSFHAVYLNVVASDGEGWEHVSVSSKTRCPRWAEMCFVKGLFWDDEDEVVQFHPRKSDYVNCHPFCLHMWRPTDHKILMPPSMLVGPKHDS